jgi:hypothetical protein
MAKGIRRRKTYKDFGGTLLTNPSLKVKGSK